MQPGGDSMSVDMAYEAFPYNDETSYLAMAQGEQIQTR